LYRSTCTYLASSIRLFFFFLSLFLFLPHSCGAGLRAVALEDSILRPMAGDKSHGKADGIPDRPLVVWAQPLPPRAGDEDDDPAWLAVGLGPAPAWADGNEESRWVDVEVRNSTRKL
jgi:hypothetical protein